MPSLNSILMLVVSDLNRRQADATVKVLSRADGALRVLHVHHGCLVASHSSAVTERLGNMLVAEGRLDPVLLEPVAQEASRRSTLIGNQLVADGLLTPAELESAIERQVRLRFENALATPGTVRVDPREELTSAVDIPLGAAVAVALRARIKLEPLRALIADRPSKPIPLNLHGAEFSRLELGPSEARICRSLAQSQPLEAVLAASPSRDSAERLVGLLVGLGLWA